LVRITNATQITRLSSDTAHVFNTARDPQILPTAAVFSPKARAWSVTMPISEKTMAMIPSNRGG
jgi:hypothetical protein